MAPNGSGRGDAGETARSMIVTLSEAATEIPAIEPGSYPVLFRSLAEERAVRPAFGRHPRLAILGPLEARLQSFDLVVLGGLNEDSWPRAAATDAWLSRPMREKLGLEQPERAIGLAAHDFASSGIGAACGADARAEGRRLADRGLALVAAAGAADTWTWPRKASWQMPRPMQRWRARSTNPKHASRRSSGPIRDRRSRSGRAACP